MSQRTERVADLVLKEVSQIVREDVQSQGIGFITFLRADVTPDLRLARVHYSVLGTDEEKKRTDIEIRNASKFIKKLLNDRVRLKFAVDLQFIRETGIEESFRVQKILDQLKKEREAKGE